MPLSCARPERLGKMRSGLHFWRDSLRRPFPAATLWKILNLFFGWAEFALTIEAKRIQLGFVCPPSCRPGSILLFDNRMIQARTRLVCLLVRST